MAAGSPLSAREAEMERARAAERAAGEETYQGTSARVAHVGKSVGLAWQDDLKQAAQELAETQSSRLLLVVRAYTRCRVAARSWLLLAQSIDTTTETMVLQSIVDAEVEDLPKHIPASEPCTLAPFHAHAARADVAPAYAFFAWVHKLGSESRRDIGASLSRALHAR